MVDQSKSESLRKTFACPAFRTLVNPSILVLSRISKTFHPSKLPGING